MTIDKAKLKALAEAATPGPWERGDGNEVSVSHEGDEAYWDWEEAGPARVHGGGPQASADADFIAAANPATVLALLAEIEALQGLYRMHKETETREMRDLKAENEALRNDAERYRWLRKRVGVVQGFGNFTPYSHGVDPLTDQESMESDEAIDAAMSKESGQ